MAHKLKRFYKGGLVEPKKIGFARRDLLGSGYAMPFCLNCAGLPVRLQILLGDAWTHGINNAILAMPPPAA